jgi:hypothetical protein
VRAADDDIKQGIGWLAKIGGYTIKKVTAGDDLKDHVLTITLTRSSDGWHQERLAFEEESQVVATVDGTNGHVDALEIVDPDEAIVDEDAATQASEPVQEPEPEKPHLVGELDAAASRNRRRGMAGTD